MLREVKKVLEKGFAIEFFKLSDFDSISNTPGIYNWHILGSNYNMHEYKQIYSSREYSASIRSNFRDIYEGTLTATSIMDSKSELLNEDLLLLSTFFMSPPVYIGIAKVSLKSRLNQHKKLLLELINGRASTIDMSGGAITSDTEVEANVFARRLGGMIVESGLKISEINLFVKTISFGRNVEPAEIVAIENFLNRTFKPVLGIN